MMTETMKKMSGYRVGVAIAVAFLVATASRAIAETPPAKQEAPAKYTVTVKLHADDVPEMKEWAEKGQQLIEQWYPRLAEQVSSDDCRPPRKIDLILKRSEKGIAGTAGTRIFVESGWFKAHPDDYGALIHEAVHVIQSYPKYDPPWLVEGIADYLRFWIYEPAAKRPRIDPKRHRYQDGYQVTGAFLAWMVEKHDKDIVRKLNVALRQGKYKPELFRTATGKDLDALWAEFSKQ